MNSENTIAITVQVVHDSGRLRVKEKESGMFVTCPRAWREVMEQKVDYVILAHLRKDRVCFVASTYQQTPEPVQAVAA